MKYSAGILALAATALATTTKDLPPCSRRTLEKGVLAGGCKINDFLCSCERADLLTPIILPHVQQMCSAADVDRAITVVEGICLNAGIPVTIPRPRPVPVPSSSYIPVPPPVSSIIRPRPTSSARVPDVSISIGLPSPSIVTITISDPLPTPILPTIPAESTCNLVTVTQTVTLRLPPVPSVVVPSVVVPSIVVPSIIVPPYPTTNVTAPLPIGTNPADPSSFIPVVPSSTGPVGTGIAPSVPAPTATTSRIPSFTGAAMALKVPAGLFGLMGFAALL